MESFNYCFNWGTLSLLFQSSLDLRSSSPIFIHYISFIINEAHCVILLQMHHTIDYYYSIPFSFSYNTDQLSKLFIFKYLNFQLVVCTIHMITVIRILTQLNIPYIWSWCGSIYVVGPPPWKQRKSSMEGQIATNILFPSQRCTRS